jgi:hypothetical protein
MKPTYSFRNALAALLIFIAGTLEAQVKTFEKTFGGSRMDYGHAMSRTADGGYILAGQSFSFGDTTSDTWLIKTDSDGKLQWMKTMGSDTLDGANSIVQTSDGGYFVLNHTEGYGAGDCEAWMFKTDTEGNILWDKTYGGAGDDIGEEGIETSSGDYIAVGFETFTEWHGNAFIAKYSSSGNMIWIKSYGAIKKESAVHILESADGGYVVAGTLYDTLGFAQDFWAFKTNSDGDLLWSKNYGGTGREEAFGFCAVPDGGFVIAGYSASYGAGDNDAYLLKIDANGNQQWSRNFGGMKNDVLRTVAVTQDGGFITGGSTESFNDSIDMLIIKTDTYGNQQWMKIIGSAGSTTEANWLVACDDGGFAIVGSKQSVGSDNTDLYFIKTDSEGNTSLNVENLTGTGPHFTVYPDPATTSITILYDHVVIHPEVQIYNALGKMIYDEFDQQEISLKSFSEGIYFITLIGDNEIYSQRFIKM